MELDRVRFVTQRYPALQGFRVLPFAALLLATALWRSCWLGPYLADPRAAVLALLVDQLLALIESGLRHRNRIRAVLGGLGIAALVAAIVASTGSKINSIATIFTMDLYRAARPNTEQKKLVSIGRIVAVVAIVIAIFIGQASSATVCFSPGKPTSVSSRSPVAGFCGSTWSWTPRSRSWATFDGGPNATRKPIRNA